MNSQAYTKGIPFFQLLFSDKNGGSKPPPYEIAYHFFRALMFRAHVVRKSITISFAKWGRGEELPSCRGVGAQSPHRERRV